MATLFRAPLYSLRASRSYSRVPHTAQGEVWFNRRPLDGAPKPFLQRDWPNPLDRNTRFPIENRTLLDPSEFWILKDRFFGGAGQPPSPTPVVPYRPAPHPIELRTWTQSLVNSTLFIPPFTAAPWPNPQPKAFATELRTIADSTEFWLLAPATASPVVPQDWLNPTRPRVSFDGQVSGTAFALSASLVRPAPTLEYPNPIRAPYAPDARTFTDGTEFWLLAPSTQAPFVPFDWPNPAVRARAIDTRTHADPSEFWLLKDTFFGGAGQPPSPTPAAPQRLAPHPIDLRTWLQNHLGDTLAPAAATPFPTTFWPNPTGKPFSVDLRTITDTTAFRRLIALVPTSQHDWPVPNGPRYPISLRSFAEFTRLLGKDRIFGGPGQPITIWPHPNPRGYRHPIDLRSLFVNGRLWEHREDLYASTIREANPVVYYRLNDDDVTAVEYLHGLANGTYVGDVTHDVLDAILYGDTAAAFTSAGAVDPSDIEFTAATVDADIRPAIQGGPAVSFEIWFKLSVTEWTPTPPPFVMDLFQWHISELQLYWVPAASSPTGVGYWGAAGFVPDSSPIEGNSVATDDANGPLVAIEPHAWTHIVYTWNAAASRQRIYVNGSLVNEAPVASTSLNFPAGARLYIGPWVEGALDEAAIYATELTPEQVAAHYALHAIPAVSDYDVRCLSSDLVIRVLGSDLVVRVPSEPVATVTGDDIVVLVPPDVEVLM